MMSVAAACAATACVQDQLQRLTIALNEERLRNAELQQQVTGLQLRVLYEPCVLCACLRVRLNHGSYSAHLLTSGHQHAASLCAMRVRALLPARLALNCTH